MRNHAEHLRKRFSNQRHAEEKKEKLIILSSQMSSVLNSVKEECASFFVRSITTNTVNDRSKVRLDGNVQTVFEASDVLFFS